MNITSSTKIFPFTILEFNSFVIDSQTLFSHNLIFLYLVSRIDSQEGESKNLTWTASFFPRAGDYKIFHIDGNKNTCMLMIRVQNDGAIPIDPVKYVYHTRPYNSTDIQFEVKNIVLTDAGQYRGGITETAARSGEGVILVVKGRPYTIATYTSNPAFK
jgi:hypothetical protein